jgi:cytochrome c-type biogenesis protein CcmH
MLWLWLALLTAATVALLLLPMLRAGQAAAPRGAHGLEVYRAQLAEVEADLERGAVNAEEAAGVRLEVQRRLLAADRESEAEGGGAPGRRGLSAVVVALMVSSLAFGLYGWLGAPGTPGQPLAQRAKGEDGAAARKRPPPGMAEVVARLAARLEREPGDMRGWMLLGRSYLELGRYGEAVEAHRKAIALGPEDAEAHAALAESLTLAAQGIVTEQARRSFEQALALAPSHPGGRYYLGLADMQAGRTRAAYERWLALAAETSPEVPWYPVLRAALEGAAEELGEDLAGIPAPAPRAPGPSGEDVAAAADMSKTEQAEMIRSMVGRLADRLEEQPDDLEGWMRLGRAYSVLGEAVEAREAYGRAAVLAPEEAPVLLAYGAAMVEAGGGERVSAEALALFERVLAADPANPDALWFAGLAKLQAGATGEAAAMWRRLLEAIPPDDRRAELARRALDDLGGAD